MKTKIGHVGIDAGLLYIGDPCYVKHAIGSQHHWGEFLDTLYKSHPDGENAPHWQLGQGIAVVTTTGYGDGLYPVYAEVRDGRVMSVTIQFDGGEAE
jgi:hypothetical protein